jgi:hypothetical protein
MSELLGKMSVRDNTYIVVSKELSGKIRQLFRFYRRAYSEDEDRLLQEIDRKNKEIHDLSNNTTKDIDGAWTSAYDRVKQSREKHTGLLRSIDKSTRTKYTGSITSFTTVKKI